MNAALYLIHVALLLKARNLICTSVSSPNRKYSEGAEGAGLPLKCAGLTQSVGVQNKVPRPNKNGSMNGKNLVSQKVSI